MITNIRFQIGSYTENDDNRFGNFINIVNNIILPLNSNDNPYYTYVHNAGVTPPTSGTYNIGGIPLYTLDDAISRQSMLSIPRNLESTVANRELVYKIPGTQINSITELESKYTQRKNIITSYYCPNYKQVKYAKKEGSCGTNDGRYTQVEESLGSLLYFNNVNDYRIFKGSTNVQTFSKVVPSISTTSPLYNMFKSESCSVAGAELGIVGLKNNSTFRLTPAVIDTKSNVNINVFQTLNDSNVMVASFLKDVARLVYHTENNKHVPIIPILGIQLTEDNLCLINYFLQTFSKTLRNYSSLYSVDTIAPQLFRTYSSYFDIALGTTLEDTSSNTLKWHFSYVANDDKGKGATGSMTNVVANDKDWLCLINGNLFILSGTFFSSYVFDKESDLISLTSIF